MRNSIISIIIFFFVCPVYAQKVNPLKFIYSAVKKSRHRYELHIKSILKPGWHIYSVSNPPGGAVATVIQFDNVKSTGTVLERGKRITVYDEEFKLNQNYFERSVDFVQVIKVKREQVRVSGSINYMLCNDRQCLPPREVKFTIELQK